MIRLKSISLILLALLTTACGPTRIDDIKSQVLSFEKLPEPVKIIYESEALKDKASFQYVVVTTDSLTSFRHEHTGMDDGILTLLTRGFNHHFHINDQHFSLEANKESPFILHNNQLYYSSTFNLSKNNYLDAEYISVDLGEHLK